MLPNNKYNIFLYLSCYLDNIGIYLKYIYYELQEESYKTCVCNDIVYVF